MKKEKKGTKKAGIWLDHAVAHFIKIKNDKVVVESILSEAENRVRTKGETATGTKLGATRATNNEHNKHKRQQNLLSKYYKQLAEELERFDIIYLFGPTTAKNELLNRIRTDKKTNNKTFIVSSAQEMTFPQMVAKAKEVLAK